MRFSKEEQRQFFDRTNYFLGTNSIDDSEVEEVIKLIEYHEWKYYVQNDPIISDFEFDTLYKILERFEAENPEVVLPYSPTQRVSSDLTSDFESASHLSPMLSLANSYNAEDLLEFDKQVRKALNLESNIQIDYAVEPKFDGGSLALVYEDGKLTRGTTRGNGQLGDNVTNNIRTLRSIPLTVDMDAYDISIMELRGEAIIRKDRFEQVNKSRQEGGLPLFANPRNAATGGLRMKNPKEAGNRGIEVFVYQLAYSEYKDLAHTMTSHSESINTLQKLGFKVPTVERKSCQGIDEVIDFCALWEKKRDSYPYEIDGMVVKVDRFDNQKKIGSTSHHPKWAIAYKFKAKQATSTLDRVEFQVGKVGSITPVAKISPVQLAGVTVSSVSLHNADFIKDKDLRIGDKVLVERAGDVIPYIVKSFDDLRTGDELQIKFPTHCPSCETPLTRSEDEAAWTCQNYECPAQQIQRLIHFVSKSAMNIDGFGRAYVERFYDLGMLHRITDIYQLDYEKLKDLDGLGSKSVEKLRKAIDQSKENPIHMLLHGLSIHHLGKKASQIIASLVSNVLELTKWTEEDYVEINEIGPVLARNMRLYFTDPEKISALEQLQNLGVNLDQTEKDRPRNVKSEHLFSGKSFLFTGTLSIGRKEAQDLVLSRGAKLISSVSKNLDYLVAGEKAGSKLKKAQTVGSVRILTEDEFHALL